MLASMAELSNRDNQGWFIFIPPWHNLNFNVYLLYYLQHGVIRHQPLYPDEGETNHSPTGLGETHMTRTSYSDSDMEATAEYDICSENSVSLNTGHILCVHHMCQYLKPVVRTTYLINEFTSRNSVVLALSIKTICP